MTHEDGLISLAERVGQRLLEKRYLLATAESCTGGGVAQALTEIPGSSQWFDCGFVTYSNQSKLDWFDIPYETLFRYGAVSERIAGMMAQGALRQSRAHVSVAITGIAGPDGASESKPIGLVCFAWAHLDGACKTEKQQFSGDRQAVRMQAVQHVLSGLLTFID